MIKLHHHRIVPDLDNRTHYYCDKLGCDLELWTDEEYEKGIWKALDKGREEGIKLGRSPTWNLKALKDWLNDELKIVRAHIYYWTLEKKWQIYEKLKINERR